MTSSLTPFTLIRSQRKSLAIEVNNAEVIVRAPHFADQKVVTKFVQAKQAWILEKIQLQQEKLSEKPCLSHGSTLLYLGEPYRVDAQRGCTQLSLENQTLYLQAANAQETYELVEQWLQSEAEALIFERCEHWAQRMQVSELVTEIRLRKTRSQWGRCTHDGRLQFNYLLIMAPIEVLDYVVIHELSHLHHMNHSRAFWNRVKQFCPNYPQLKSWLKENGHKLSLTPPSHR